MELTEPLQFDHTDRRDIYDYVESHGTASADEVRRALNIEPRPFGHHVAILQRDGMLERDGDELRVAYEDPGEEAFETESVEFTIRQARQEDLTGLVGAIRAAIGSGEYVDAETVADIIDSEGSCSGTTTWSRASSSWPASTTTWSAGSTSNTPRPRS